MQTFLPYPDFVASARVLDRQRLGKQRLEAWQLLRGGWPHHPAAKMWRGYEAALAYYGWTICNEWQARGYENNLDFTFNPAEIVMPPWVGDDRVHGSHRANLLRKDPVWYGRFGWTDDPALPYYWPV